MTLVIENGDKKMHKTAWLLPVLLLVAPSFAEAKDVTDLSAIDSYQSGALEGAKLSKVADDMIVLAQDSSSDYAIKFEYSNSAYSDAEIANYGEAFQQGVLAATAEVTEVQEISANQARVRVEVTHFAEDGQILYEGIVYFRKGLPGNVISETVVSGTRDHRIFTTWPTW